MAAHFQERMKIQRKQVTIFFKFSSAETNFMFSAR